jgi:hypothetical protein
VEGVHLHGLSFLPSFLHFIVRSYETSSKYFN